MRSIGLAELLVLFFGILCLFGFAVFLMVLGRWKQSRSVQRALIEKLPPQELASLLQTPQGEKLLQALGEGGASPGGAILASLQRGTVVVFTGIGLLATATFTQWQPVLMAMAVVVIFVGIGLLVAASLAYRLSKRWNLLGGDRDTSSGRRDN